MPVRQWRLIWNLAQVKISAKGTITETDSKQQGLSYKHCLFQNLFLILLRNSNDIPHAFLNDPPSGIPAAPNTNVNIGLEGRLNQYAVCLSNDREMIVKTSLDGWALGSSGPQSNEGFPSRWGMCRNHVRCGLVLLARHPLSLFHKYTEM